MSQIVEVEHHSMAEGRKRLAAMDFSELGIPSITPQLDTRWRAEFKGKFLDPGENALFLDEVLKTIRGLKNVTTQRDVYYALRGAHPEWTYKGEPLGAPFYEHLIMWIMEKAQLKTGLTMQAMGIEAGPRGWIAGDGAIQVPRRGRVDLKTRPSLSFDIADEGVTFATYARKLIHFEKDSGMGALVSEDFPRYVEAIFSNSNGQLTESATKFMRMAEDRGMELYAVHDADPAGMQMQLMYGMASKNNCYMPSEFYPTLVKPLGFYPSVGAGLNLPPEEVTDKEDKIFGNLIALSNEKSKMFPQLRRFNFGREVNVLIQKRQKWEFQALSAIHETAPKVYILEALRVHRDDVKFVPDAEEIKQDVISSARAITTQEVEPKLAALAQALYEKTLKKQLIDTLRTALAPQITDFNEQVSNVIQLLTETEAENFREQVKSEILGNPALYAVDVVKKLGRSIVSASFNPRAGLRVSIDVTNISATNEVLVSEPPHREPATKTMLVTAIEQRIIKDARTRMAVVSRIRTALEDRFGVAREAW